MVPCARTAGLQTLDPEAAARVHANDRRRVVRALELADAGSSLAGDALWSSDTRRPTLVFGLDVTDEVLEERIAARTDWMLEHGAVDEARAALARPLSRSARKVMGLVDFAELPADEARAAVVGEQPPARAVPTQVDAAHPGAGRGRRESRRGRGRCRDRGDGARPWNAWRVIRQVLREDWERLRDVRLRALAHDPEAFLETHAQASTFPDELWQRARHARRRSRRLSWSSATVGSTGS